MPAPWGVKDMHGGDDYALLDAPYGHKWSLATRRTNYTQGPVKIALCVASVADCEES